LSVKPRGALKELKNKNKKARDMTTSPIPAGHAAFWAATTFGTWGRVANVIIFAKFQENQFRGYG